MHPPDAQHSATPTSTEGRTADRRQFLKTAGGILGVGAVTALAGCTASAGLGKPKTPLTASVTGPYVLDVWPDSEYQEKFISFVELTLKGNPDDWPSFTRWGTTYTGFLGKLATNEGNPEPIEVYFDHPTFSWSVHDNWYFGKSEFVNDETETIFLVLSHDHDPLPEPGTEYTFFLYDPESEEFHDLVSFTYDDPEDRDPRDE